LVAPWGLCASSFLDGTHPSRKGEPKKMAGRWRDRLFKKSPRLQWMVILLLDLVSLCQFSRRENMGFAYFWFCGDMLNMVIMSYGLA